MVLIKCSCGCHSTLHSDYFSKRTAYKCPNCQLILEIDESTEICKMNKILEDSKFKIYSIPDSSDIDFKFNL